MPLYLTLSRGPRADLATPVLASADPRVINAALEAIHRLGEADNEEDTAAVNAAVGELGWRVVGRGASAPDGGGR